MAAHGDAFVLALYGLSLIGAPIFPAEAGRGSPPGTRESSGIGQAGLMHFAC